MATHIPKLEFVKKITEEYKCCICTNLLDTPVLTECCGQHFCKDCLEKWIARKKATICPHCRAENFNKIVSKPLDRKIKELQVYCRNKKNGCKNIQLYGTFHEHLISCPFGVVKCDNDCKKAGLLRKNMKKHLAMECSNRIVACAYCKQKGQYCSITGVHFKICPEASLECPKACGNKIKRKDLEKHEKICPFGMVECPFKEVGCEVTVLRRTLPEHERSAVEYHLRLTMTSNKKKNEELKKSYEELQQNHDKLKQDHQDLKQDHEELKQNLDSILSVADTELGSHNFQSTPSAEKLESLFTTLTSLTTMIKPGDQFHTVHISNELGLCRKKTVPGVIASSPLLWIYPGIKIYLCVMIQHFCVRMEESKNGYFPKNMCIRVQDTTGGPELILEMNCQKINQFHILLSRQLPQVESLTDFYVNVNFNEL